MSGYTLTQDELLYELVTAVTKNTYTAQAVISAAASGADRCVIPVKYFSAVGKSLSVKFKGTIGSAAGTATFVLAAGLDAAAGTIAGTGGATLFTTATITPTTTTVPFDGELEITAQAVGNLVTTLQCNGSVRVAGAASSSWSTAANLAMFANNLTGVDNEKQFWLELFGTWSVSAAGNTTTLQQFKVYGEN